jgi:hypothetical protein
MSRSYTSSPPKRHMVCSGTAFLLILALEMTESQNFKFLDAFRTDSKFSFFVCPMVTMPEVRLQI